MSLIEDYKTVLKVAGKHNGSDGDILEYYVLRPVSAALLLIFRRYHCSPNVYTSVSIAFSLLAGIFVFFAHHYPSVAIGVIFLNLALLFDSFDGAYARYKGKSSEFGGWYDQISDSIKYNIFLIFMITGAYYNLDRSNEWTVSSTSLLMEHRELILVFGLLIIANMFLIYIIHNTRHQLSINPGNMVTVGGNRFYFGIESLLYSIFTIFLLTHQIYLLIMFLVVFLPVLWIYPFYMTYSNSQSNKTEPNEQAE